MVAPGPPAVGGKGYQVRLYHQILGLAESHEVFLVTFAPGDELEPELVAACRRVTKVPWSLPAAFVTALAHAASLPVSVALFRSHSMAAALTAQLSTANPDLVQLQLVRMAPYLEHLSSVPVVLDLLDAAELNMRERARAARPGARQLLEVEAGRLGAYEKKAVARTDLSLLISGRDLEYIGNPRNARVLPNGIDPEEMSAAPRERRPATVIFSGTMSYFPNADAATWFARDILPLVRGAIPSVMFRIVGREPTPAVRQLASLPGMTVTGSVPQISEEIAGATVSVCPMRFGSGMQTKILEAMAAGTPVVATPKAMEGIPDDLHRFVHQADSADAFAAEVVRILSHPEPASQLAADGLDAIRRDHTWRRHVSDLEDLYAETISSATTGRRGLRQP